MTVEAAKDEEKRFILKQMLEDAGECFRRTGAVAQVLRAKA